MARSSVKKPHKQSLSSRCLISPVCELQSPFPGLQYGSQVYTSGQHSLHKWPAQSLPTGHTLLSFHLYPLSPKNLNREQLTPRQYLFICVLAQTVLAVSGIWSKVSNQKPTSSVRRQDKRNTVWMNKMIQHHSSCYRIALLHIAKEGEPSSFPASHLSIY